MKHTPIQSSTISSAAYDEEKQELHVKFNTGLTYVYSDVPPEKYQGLMQSSSKGRFLHKHIKSAHEFSKL